MSENSDEIKKAGEFAVIMEKVARLEEFAKEHKKLHEDQPRQKIDISFKVFALIASLPPTIIGILNLLKK